MDEGVGGYVSYMVLGRSAYKDSVAAWHRSQLEIARRALAEGKWLRLKDISYAFDWNLASASSPGLASAEAYVVVSYLVSTYGLEKCVFTYQDVGHSGDAELEVSTNFGITFDQLEAAAQAWLKTQ